MKKQCLLMSATLFVSTSLFASQSFAATPQQKTSTLTATVNVRTSASATSKLKAILKKGNTISVTKTQKVNNVSWSKITWRDVSGWIQTKYIKTTTIKPTITTIAKSYVTTANVNVRKSASLTSARITSIAKNKTIKATKKSGDWVYIPTVKGWVNVQNLKIVVQTTTQIKIIDQYYTTTKITSAYRSSSNKSAIVSTIKKNEQFHMSKMLGQYVYSTTLKAWLPLSAVKISGKSVIEELPENESPIEQVTTITYMTTAPVNVRAKAEKDAKVINSVAFGKVIIATRNKNKWVYVPKLKGWIYEGNLQKIAEK